jgi:Tfp pilus assembly protein PilF
MNRRLPCLFLLLLGLAWRGSAAAAPPLEQRAWVEVRTAHFNIYSCGALTNVYKLAGRLEQFCKAYAQLAGATAVASPPIVVLAFPDHESLKPFLPLYHGRPGNLAAFFQRGADENLIVLSLPEPGTPYTDMEIIFHEYTHLLFRRNDQLWPLWLKEGMAEIYSTFQTAGQTARIASAIPYHLQTLREHGLMPLAELFSVQPDSPQYNETERQGVFYAEAWLLTHFLMTGNNGIYRARFGQFTTLLRQGQLTVPAFTNAMGAPLPVVEAELRRYLERGVFAPIDLSLSSEISSPVSQTTRALTPVEIYFRLGDELLRAKQTDAAATHFNKALAIAPASPLGEEGLGLLANERHDREACLKHLRAAIALGSRSYLTFYLCALQEFKATADADDRYTRLKKNLAAEIRGHLLQSMTLMPDFGPAQQLAGVLEMVQGEHLADAGQHLQRAIQLEPENPSYRMSLAQYQCLMKNFDAARQTLEPLLHPNANAQFRADAEKLVKEIDRHQPMN